MAVKVCPVDHQHGKKATCYVSHRCRCAGCRAAEAERAAKKWVSVECARCGVARKLRGDTSGGRSLCKDCRYVLTEEEAQAWR